jgi:CxxC motif-containing protein (DUF1111 family)
MRKALATGARRYLLAAMVVIQCSAAAAQTSRTSAPASKPGPVNRAPSKPEPPKQEPPRAAPPRTPQLGAPLDGLTPNELARFRAGKLAFEEVEGIEDGIGPVFNADSCAACHGEPAIGGGNARVFSTRIATRTQGKFDPLIRLGGPVLQRQGIIGLDFELIPGEVVPREATIVARRRTTPCFGFGLVDAVPDAFFQALAAKQALTTPATAGRVNKVMDLRTGKTVVGKFGWKCGVANLLNFSGDAYKEEMGITSPGWKRDRDGRLIDEENPPQGNVELLELNPVCSPNEPDLEDVIAFADFMSFLAPPPRGPINASVTAGEKIFTKIGCADCHSPSLVTGPSNTKALSLVTFNPYSDFLVHDMGALGDGIEQGIAKGSEMRTSPLWGLRFQTALLHDGRSPTIEHAIGQHAGQGTGSRDKFNKLSAADRAVLMAFLKSL